MFYFLRQNLFGHTVETGALSWISGQKFQAPLKLQTLIVNPVHGDNFPDFFDSTVPVMSNRLIDFLINLGVDNIDRYPVILNNIASGEDVGGYSAVNVIGCIDAEKLEESTYRLRFGKPYFTGGITIDKEKVGDASFFRTVYGPGFIVISQRIADALKAENWSGILLQPTVDFQVV
jgi:hypothetical protein